MFHLLRSAAAAQRNLLSQEILVITKFTAATTDDIFAVARRYRSNRSRRGLYDGKDIQTGNNVPFSLKKTKRKFKPNVFTKRVYSETLDAMIPFHVTAAALRSIDKAGGLDNYLMKNEFTEGEGHTIKKKIKKRLKNQAYLERKGKLSTEAGVQAV